MQGYEKDFAQVYNMRWTHFAKDVAPKIHTFFEANSRDLTSKRILDIACGTGQLAVYFLERGYEVVGLDLSSAMLAHARENARAYIEQSKARFVEADAADFTMDERFGLAISTFDALNHLPDFDDLAGCFVSTAGVLEPGGWFIFDLNTRFGLQRWGGISVQEEEDLVLITRGVVSEQEGRAYTQISGFLRRLDDVALSLQDAGFDKVYFAAARALDVPLDAPETYGRVFIVAQKSADED